MEESDETLMRKVASGDREAFGVVMKRYGRRLMALALNVLRSPAGAEDVVQEAFVRVWLRADSFDAGQSQLTTWLHRIVVNLCIDQVRKQRPESDDELDLLPDHAPDALGRALDDERRDAVRRAMRDLGVRHRAALTLFHFQDLSGRDCAAAMDISESAFESLLTRARAALRQSLLAYMET